MKFNPYAFGVAGYPLGGAEDFIYNFLKAVYKEKGEVVHCFK